MRTELTMMMKSSILLILSAMVLAADASVPEGLRRFFFPGGIGNADSTFDKTQTQVNPQEDQDIGDRMSKLQSSIEEARRSYSIGDIAKYMPEPVRNAECFYEYQVTQRQPGRCIKLGGHTPACQTKDFVTINYSECS